MISTFLEALPATRVCQDYHQLCPMPALILILFFAGKEGLDSSRVWQPYADYLVYSVLMALPWGGTDLAEGAPAELDKLLESAEKYMELRPQQLTSALRPFFQGEDEASTSDSGAASFLGQVKVLNELHNLCSFFLDKEDLVHNAKLRRTIVMQKKAYYDEDL